MQTFEVSLKKLSKKHPSDIRRHDAPVTSFQCIMQALRHAWFTGFHSIATVYTLYSMNFIENQNHLKYQQSFLYKSIKSVSIYGLFS